MLHIKNMTKTEIPSGHIDKQNNDDPDTEKVHTLASLGEAAALQAIGENEQDRERLMEGLEKFINDEKTIDQIVSFPEGCRDRLIGELIRAYLVFKDEKYSTVYLERLRDCLAETGRLDNYDDPLIDTIAMSLGTDPTTQDGKESIHNYYQANYGSQSYHYHGFNGAFKEAVEKNGLTTTQRIWDWGELRAIHDIATQHHTPMLLGWGMLNSESGVFVTDSPKLLYGYANASPEWFAQFVAEGFHIPNIGHNKQAFNRKDYKQAKENIENTCGAMGVTADEYDTIMAFFEKYWHILAAESANSPQLAIISHPKPIYSWQEKCASAQRYGDMLEPTLVLFNPGGVGVDKKLTEDIPPKDVQIVQLPAYSLIHPLEAR